MTVLSPEALGNGEETRADSWGRDGEENSCSEDKVSEVDGKAKLFCTRSQGEEERELRQLIEELQLVLLPLLEQFNISIDKAMDVERDAADVDTTSEQQVIL